MDTHRWEAGAHYGVLVGHGITNKTQQNINNLYMEGQHYRLDNRPHCICHPLVISVAAHDNQE